MIAEKIIQKACEKVQGAQVTVVTRETSAVDFENNRLKSAESSQRTKIDLKVIVEGKVGVSTTTDLGDIDGVIERAVEAAQFGSKAHFELPEPQKLNPVDIFDPALLSLEKTEMIHLGNQIMEMIKAYNPEILAGAQVNKVITKIHYANSKGASYAADHTDFYIGAGGNLIRGTDVLFAGNGFGHKKREVDIEEIASKAIELFRKAEKIVPVKSGEMPVIFMPEGLLLLLLSLQMATDGKNVLLGASPLRDKLGEMIADSRLTIVDDPFVQFGPDTSAFDDEGTMRQITPIIENGVLRNFIYDRDTAGRAGVKPTGHGSQRHWTNLMINSGETSYEDMIKGIEHGLLVNDFLGMGQGNPINGEFSVNVFLGYKIENGKITGRIKDVMLSGNAFTAFENITAISKEREWVVNPYLDFSGFFPYIKVDKLSVTAKASTIDEN
ncbi:MAG: TldD/PmbA family protein [Anaerolineales bacterium]